MSNQVFFYINGEPLNGDWIDMDNINDWIDIKEELADRSIISRLKNVDPDYDGDLLAADAEGALCSIFLGRYGSFDLDDFIEARNNDFDEDAVAAFINCFSEWNKSKFEESYLGQFEDDIAFIMEQTESYGLLDGVPESIKFYFDYERFASDEMINSYDCDNGHYFIRW